MTTRLTSESLLPLPEQFGTTVTPPPTMPENPPPGLLRSLAAGRAVRDLRGEGLTYAQIQRLCRLTHNHHLLQGLEAGTVRRMSTDNAERIIDGYRRYIAGDTSYMNDRDRRAIIRNATTPTPKPAKVAPARTPKPAKVKATPAPTPIRQAETPTLSPRPSLRERLAAKRKAAA